MNMIRIGIGIFVMGLMVAGEAFALEKKFASFIVTYQVGAAPVSAASPVGISSNEEGALIRVDDASDDTTVTVRDSQGNPVATFQGVDTGLHSVAYFRWKGEGPTGTYTVDVRKNGYPLHRESLFYKNPKPVQSLSASKAEQKSRRAKRGRK